MEKIAIVEKGASLQKREQVCSRLCHTIPEDSQQKGRSVADKSDYHLEEGGLNDLSDPREALHVPLCSCTPMNLYDVLVGIPLLSRYRVVLDLHFQGCKWIPLVFEGHRRWDELRQRLASESEYTSIATNEEAEVIDNPFQRRRRNEQRTSGGDGWLLLHFLPPSGVDTENRARQGLVYGHIFEFSCFSCPQEIISA